MKKRREMAAVCSTLFAWYFIVQGGSQAAPGHFQIMGDFLSYEQCQTAAKEVAEKAKPLFVGTCWSAWPKEPKTDPMSTPSQPLS
jgi:hypothetical protein